MRAVGVAAGVVWGAWSVLHGAPSVRHFDVAVSAAFLPDEREAVREALDAWSSAVPELRFGVTWDGSGCDPSAPRKPRHELICIAPAGLEWIAWEMGAAGPPSGDAHYVGVTTRIVNVPGIGTWATVHVGTHMLREDVAAVVAHELGHAMGLHHSTAPDALMAPVMPDGASPRPTWRDVAAWYSVPR